MCGVCVYVCSVYWYVVCARVAMCSCSRPRAKCLSNYFAQLSAGRACVFILSHCKNNNNNNWRRSRSWRRTTAASLTVCLCLSNCKQAATAGSNIPTGHASNMARHANNIDSSVAVFSQQGAATAASRAKKPLRKLMWQTCASAATPTAHRPCSILPPSLCLPEIAHV